MSPKIPRAPRDSILITARYRVVTPAFVRGADQAKAELRSTSFKGVLRFWWRALYWSRAMELAANDPDRALALLHDHEAGLFGIAATKAESTGGQGLLQRLHFAAVGKRSEYPAGSIQNTTDAYMLGQGLSKWDREKRAAATTSSAIAATDVQATLCIHAPDQPHENSPQIESVVDALVLLGIVGGIGARSRRGCGSLALTGLEINQEPQPARVPRDFESLHSTLDGLINRACGVQSLPPFTALSEHAQYACKPAGTLEELRRDVGAELIRYRSSGQESERDEYRVLSLRDSRGRPERAEGVFEDDHQAMGQALGGSQAYSLPRRVAFGLPHNYRFSNGKEVAINARLPGANGSTDSDRRASPLFVHYHQFPDGKQHCAVLTYLPARFLPSGAQVVVTPKVANGNAMGFTPPELDLANSVIPDFLDRF